MAGHAFCRPGRRENEPALRCPRMSPKLYAELRARIQQALHKHFSHVVIAAEAPEKKDHGDVDILVCGPLGELSQMNNLRSMQHIIAETIEATRYRISHGVLFMAAPIPAELIEHDSLAKSVETDEEPVDENLIHPEVHIQYDLVLIDAPSQLAWAEFRQAHGDLCNILQTGLQDAGFTFKPSGLHVRIEAMEGIDTTGMFLFLSNDPKQVFAYFGMDPTKYSTRFESTKELFEWISCCKYFSRRQLALPSGADGSISADTPEVDQPATMETKTGTRKTEGYFTYMSDRPMYSRFRQEWLPANPEVGAQVGLTRAEILKDAVAFFGVELSFYATMTAFAEREAEKMFWARVDKLVPLLLGPQSSKTMITQVKEALKRYVQFEEHDGYGPQPVIAAEAQMDTQLQPGWIKSCKDGGFTEYELLDWIELHWQTIREKDRARTRPERHARRDRAMERKRKREIVHWLKITGYLVLCLCLVGWLFFARPGPLKLLKEKGEMKLLKSNGGKL